VCRREAVHGIHSARVVKLRAAIIDTTETARYRRAERCTRHL
jgi:hypothetical protein